MKLLLGSLFIFFPIVSNAGVVPTNDMLEIWEHSCIKNLKNGDISGAIGNLKVMNWQCDNKQGLAYDEKTNFLSEFETKLAEARKERELQQKAGKKWICNPPSSQVSSRKKIFFDSIGKHIQDYLNAKGINNPEATYVVMAQVAQETAWGKSIIDTNYFNIKGKYNNRSIDVTTHEEYVEGQRTKIKDSFRVYASTEQSLGDYLNLLQQKWPDAYHALSLPKGIAKEFINGLNGGKKGGYATDKKYSTKLNSIYETIKAEIEGRIYPTYLKCLGREKELEKVKGGGL